MLALCTDCRNLKAAKGKTMHERLCPECGNSKMFPRKIKPNELCQKCSGKARGKKLVGARYKNHQYIRYWKFCPTCPVVKTIKVKPKTPWCGDCSRKHAKTLKSPCYYNLKDMKMEYFRICPHCPIESNSLKVGQASHGGIKPCRIHKWVGKEDKKSAMVAKQVAARQKTTDARPPKHKKKPKVYIKDLSSSSIKKAQEINREHKAAQAKVKLITQTKTHEEMMAEYLSTHTVVTVESPELVDAYIGEVHIRGY